ncbi:MAG: TolC family protein, partial [Treponema sp.]|nr:TolC family protein [Treponema sp.]
MKLGAILVLFLAGALCFAQEEKPLFNYEIEPEHKTFSLEKAITLAVENNYDIQKQRYALQEAHSQFLQAKGATDIEAGAQAQYQRKQNPVDEFDPN